MTAGPTHRRGRIYRPATWALVAALLGTGIIAGLLLIEDAAPRFQPEATPTRDPASGDGETLETPEPLAVPEDPLTDPPTVTPSRREITGATRYSIEGVVLDTQTGLPVPLYEVYSVPGVGGDHRLLPETHPPHHVRDVEGRFRLTTPIDGVHQLLIRSETHEDAFRHVTVPLDLPLELYLKRGTWLSGTLRNMSGKPQPDVPIWLHSRGESPGARAEARTRSDDEGRYAFFKLEPGVYRLTAGPLTAPFHVRDDLRILDREHAQVDLLLPRLTELLVHVRSTEGRPIPEARVTLLTEEGRVVRTGIASVEGLVRIPHVQQGPHVLQIRAVGFAQLEEELYLSATRRQVEHRVTLTR